MRKLNLLIEKRNNININHFPPVYVVLDGGRTVQLEYPVQALEVQSPAGHVRADHRRTFGVCVKMLESLHSFVLLQVTPETGEIEAGPKVADRLGDEPGLNQGVFLS